MRSNSPGSDSRPISVKDPQTARAVRKLAKATGQPITDTIRSATEAQYGRLFPAHGDRAKRLQAFIARSRERVIIDQRGADEIIGYDEHGLPR